MDQLIDISLTVNGEPVSARISPRTNLVDFLRVQLDLTGSHVGCEHGVCGACTVRVNGSIVRGGLMLAAQVDGETVVTIEGLHDSGEISDLQRAFLERNALQCGFCTPGMLLTSEEYLKNIGDPNLLRTINAVKVIMGNRRNNPKEVVTRSNIRFI